MYVNYLTDCNGVCSKLGICRDLKFAHAISRVKMKTLRYGDCVIILAMCNKWQGGMKDGYQWLF
jgi:hypothetical protein